MLQPNPTRVWDTFAEPNNLNNTECSFRTKSGLITPFGVTSPKKQVNRRRLRTVAAQNLSYGVQKHLTKSSGLFLFFPVAILLTNQFRVPPQYLQYTAS